jgi:preprotein translocase subunit SecY
LTALQAYGTIILLSRTTGSTVVSEFTPFQWFVTLLSIVAGTMLLLWIGEIISEYKIGNGISLIIFAGIVAQLPTAVQQMWVNLTNSSGQLTSQGLITAVIYAAIAVFVLGAIVLVTEAQRNIPVSYAKRVRGNKLYGGVNTHLPLRINQAGVIPIIFAISILLFPGLLANFLCQCQNCLACAAATNVNNFFQNQTYYGIMYFLLVVVLSHISTPL